jgi:hypothetical protein
MGGPALVDCRTELNGRWPDTMRRSKVLVAVTICVLASLFMTIVPARTFAADPAKFTVSQIIAGMKGSRARLNDGPGWVLRYKQRLDSRNPLPDEYSGIYPDGEFVNAQKGDWWYVSEKQEPPFGREDSDATVQSWSCWKNGISVERIANNVWILPEPSVHSRQSFWYMRDLFMNVPTSSKAAPPLSRVFGSGGDRQPACGWLPEAIEDHERDFMVRPLQEDVDGARCHVIEWPDHDIIWVDCSRGYLVVRRIYYQSPASPLLEGEHFGLREIKPGVWLPSKEVTTIYNRDTDPKAFAGKVKLVETNSLLDCRFDNVPDSLFDVPRISQGKVTDYVRGITYVKYPPEIDPFEEAIRHTPIEPSKYSDVPRIAWLEMGLLIAIGVNGIMLLVRLVRLVSRHGRGPVLAQTQLLTNEEA